MRRALFWDFHGTLSYPDSLWSRNVYITAKEILPDCSMELQEVKDMLDNDGFPWHHPERSYTNITEPKLWWAHVEKLFYNTYKRLGFTDEQAKLLAPNVRERILDASNYRLYEQAKDVLAELKNNGFIQIMVSSNFPELKEICDRLGISEYFDDFVISALAGYEKPRREIFDIALKRANSPDLCFMIGDNPVADIEGAKNAGIKSILVNSGEKSCADYTFSNLGDLKDALLNGIL